MSRLVLAALLASAAVAIYPDDHWDHSTELTEENFDEFIESNVDAGKTVRNFSPGAGGWPTVRYFNKETGYEGKPYPKKTSKSMCDELGDEEYMRAYVEEMGQTSLCSAETGQGCGEKETAFIEKWKAKDESEVTAQLKRLEGMADAKAKPELLKWIRQRMAILKQLAGTAAAGKEEL